MSEYEDSSSTARSDENKESMLMKTALFASGVLVGLVAGFFLFAATYPWLGPATTRIWPIVLQDGVIIVFVGTIAYCFRHKSPFFPGLLTALCVVFIVNALCGVSR